MKGSPFERFERDAPRDQGDLQVLIELVDSFDRQWRAAGPDAKPEVEPFLDALIEPLRPMGRRHLDQLVRELQGGPDGFSDNATTHDPDRDWVDLAPHSGAGNWVGRASDRHEILAYLGHGGMGEVFKARDRITGKIVALKVIRQDRFAHLDDADRAAALRRFNQEIRLAAALDHAHIVPIYDAGTWDGHPYFTMRYIEGQSLSEVVRQGPMVPIDAAKCIHGIANAIAHAHERGLIHRDIKPHNILNDRKGTPYLVDFGLAKNLGFEGTELTESGGLVGTIAYLAPEALKGSRLATASSDQYSLGATLYHLLTGRPPFQSSNLSLMMQLIETEDPLSPRKLNPAVPPDLEQICLKCLRKNPTDRYASAASLADDLLRFLDDRPVRARPLRPWTRLWRWSASHPAQAALASMSVGVIAVAIALAAWWTVQRTNDAIDRKFAELRVSPASGAAAIINDLKRDRFRSPRRLPTHQRSLADSADFNIALATFALDPDASREAGLLNDLILSLTGPETPPERIQAFFASVPIEPSREAIKRSASRLVEDARTPAASRLRAAGILSGLRAAPGDNPWEGTPLARELAHQLIEEPPSDLRGWAELFRATPLFEAVIELHADEGSTESTRVSAAILLANWLKAPSLEDRVADVLSHADGRDLALVAQSLRSHPSELERLKQRALDQNVGSPRTRARWAAALLVLDKFDEVSALFDQAVDNTTRSLLVVNSARWGVPFQVYMNALEGPLTALDSHPEANSRRRALIQALGAYRFSAIPGASRERGLRYLTQVFKSTSDSGCRESARWVLRASWKQPVPTDSAPTPPDALWSDENGLTMVFVPSPARGSFDEKAELQVASHPFAIATTELTRGVYRTVMKRGPSGDDDLPMTNLTASEVDAFLVELSRRSSSTPVDRPPYRLPSDQEWYTACLGKSQARVKRPFGDDATLVAYFTWHLENSGNLPHPVGLLLPNDLGLFDMLGNVHERVQPRPFPKSDWFLVDRGGAYHSLSKLMELDAFSAPKQVEPGAVYQGIRIARDLTKIELSRLPVPSRTISQP